jgi:hypothetical protein
MHLCIFALFLLINTQNDGYMHFSVINGNVFACGGLVFAQLEGENLLI